MYFLSDICSLCLRLVPHQNIKSILSLDTDGTVIEDKLRPVLLELIHFRPNVPKYICSNCLLDLNCIYKFRQKWLENITTLKKYVHKLEKHGPCTNLSVPLTDTKYDKEHSAEAAKQNYGASYLKETESVQGNVAVKSVFNEYENSNTMRKDNLINLSVEVKIEIEATIHSFLEDTVVKQELEDISYQTPYEIFKEFNDEKDIEENVNISKKLLHKKSQRIAKSRVSTNLKVEDIQENVNTSEELENKNSKHVSEPEPFEDNDSDDEYLPSDASSSATSETGDSDLDAAETQALSKIIESKETNSNVIEYATGELNIKQDFVNMYDDIDIKDEPVLPENTSTDFEIKSILKDEDTNNAENLLRLNSSPRGTGVKANDCSEVQNRELKQSIPVTKYIYTVENPYKCDVCDKAYSVKDNLMIHKRTHTGEKPYTCDACDKAFSLKRSLILHKRTHTGEKPYKCDVCNKAFSRTDSLLIHKRTHTDEKPYKCHVCNKAFSRTDCLSLHKRTHTGEKPYKCHVCNKAFSRADRLLVHKRIHTGEKPYNCDVCQKAFNQINNLKIHKRTHISEKPYKCDVCHKTFNQKKSLIIHKRTHTSEKPHKCDVCDKAFSLKNYLKHKRTHC